MCIKIMKKVTRETDQHFTAEMSDGGVRIGIKGVIALDLPPTDQRCATVRAIAQADDFDAQAEAFIDNRVEDGTIDIRVF